MKYDSADLDAMDLLVASRGYQLLAMRLELMKGQYLVQLIQPSSPEETAKLRGAIAAVEVMIELPKTLKREIRKNMTEAA